MLASLTHIPIASGSGAEPFSDLGSFWAHTQNLAPVPQLSEANPSFFNRVTSNRAKTWHFCVLSTVCVGTCFPHLVLTMPCTLGFIISSIFQAGTLWSVLQTFPKGRASGAETLSQTVGLEGYVCVASI